MSRSIKHRHEGQALLEVLGLGHLRRVVRFTVSAEPGAMLEVVATLHVDDAIWPAEHTQLYVATLAPEQPKPKREPFDLDTACMRAQARIAIDVLQSAARHLDEMASKPLEAAPC